MPYQTVVSPCYSCKHGECKKCEHRVYANILKLGVMKQEELDEFVENLWRENEDIAWVEDDERDIVLDQPWRGFPVGLFTQNDWFRWVDVQHSKGVGWVYENIGPYDFEVGGK